MPPLSVLVGLIGLQAAYWLCTRVYRDRFPGATPVSDRQQWLFAEGVVVLFLALASPLHILSDEYLFTAHMVQHLLIVLVAAPLLLAGTPGWLLDELLGALRLKSVMRTLRHPLLAYGAFNLLFTMSHIPAVYEFALSHELLHATEHTLFLLSGVVLWIPILSPLPKLLPRYHELGQLLYFFAQTVPASLLGAFLASAGAPAYPTYAQAPRIIEGLSPLDDQKLGGLFMWVGGGTYFLVATAIVFFRWANREEAENRRPARAGV